ncbi:MAG TPA: peptidylprolyl isomerase [Brumimicrobium sp.]|nr:peptidylprolyl isomerase [Brumimicrobium sp.]
MSQVKKDKTVKVHYTGKLTNGEVFDSSDGREPLEFTVGAGQMIPGFENGILDMKLNEKKIIEIPASEAYGERREELMQEVPKNQLPEEIKPEVGMPLMAQLPDGGQQQLVIAEVREESIVVDANHPLAGKDLVFDVEVVEIN